MAVPTNTSPPTITAQRVVGQTVTGTNGTWTGSPTFTRKWQRAHVIYYGGHQVTHLGELVTGPWEDISGETALTYVRQAGDHRTLLRLEVTATNGDGSAVEYSAESLVATAVGKGFGTLTGAMRGVTSEEEED